jgi:hypothetical protein
MVAQMPKPSRLCSLARARLLVGKAAMVRSVKKTTRNSSSALPPATASGSAPIIAATIGYERWLHKRIDVVEADLELKHQQMAGSLFAFLRATFYRWASLWPEVCPDLVEAPRVLAVGDLHVENFGAWRDTEGRLIWGVNDFDEVANMPYAVDLVRLYRLPADALTAEAAIGSLSAMEH